MKVNKFVKGTVILSISGILSKILSSFFRIPLSNIISTEGISYYQNVYSLYVTLIAITSIGLPQLLSKVIATSVAKKNNDEAKLYFNYILKLSIFIGLAITVGLLLFANLITKLAGWDHDIVIVIYTFSIAPIFIGISGTIRGYFQGIQYMTPTAVSQVVEGFAKVFIGVGLAYYLVNAGYSLPVAAAGAAVGTVLGTVLSTLYLIIVYKYHKNKLSFNNLYKSSEQNILTNILKLTIPVTIGASSYSIMNVIDSFLFYNRLETIDIIGLEAKEMFGEITMGNSIINVPLALALGIIVSTVPSISSSYALNNKDKFTSSINLSLKLSSILSFPAAIGLIVLAKPIMLFLFPSQQNAHIYLPLLGVCLPLLILSQTMISVLHGMGKFKIVILSIALAAVSKIVLNYTLIPTSLLGKGAVIGSIGYCFVLMVTNFWIFYKNSKVKINSTCVFIKPLIASLIMGIVTMISYNFLEQRYSNIITIGIATFASIVVYLGLITVFKVFKPGELGRIRSKPQERTKSYYE